MKKYGNRDVKEDSVWEYGNGNVKDSLCAAVDEHGCSVQLRGGRLHSCSDGIVVRVNCVCVCV